MNWLYNLKTSSKLTLGFGAILFAVLVMSVVGYVSLNTTASAAKHISEDAVRGVATIKQVNIDVIRLRLRQYRALSQDKPADRAKTLKTVEEGSGVVDKGLDLYAKFIDSEKEKELFEAVKSAWSHYEEASKPWSVMIQEAQMAEAVKYTNTTLMKIGKEELDKSVDALVAFNDENAGRLAKQADQTAASAKQKLFLLAIGSVLAGAFLAWRISAHISGSVNAIYSQVDHISKNGVPSLQSAMQAMANYDLTTKAEWNESEVPEKHKDDLGLLSSRINGLITGLNDTVDQFHIVQDNMIHIVEKVQQGARDVNDTSSNLTASTEQSGAASTEIAQGSEKLAQSSQSAANVMETLHQSASEVFDSSKKQAEALMKADEDLAKATQIASNVATSAQQAMSVAVEGKGKVDQIVAANGRITDQVSLSSQQVRELDAASHEIVAIVQTIEQVSEQTNLLALNAAIEAARAGEHGRGFAVVAEEVRKLAEQAQGATKQIVGMIDNVRNKVAMTVDSIQEMAPLVLATNELSAQAGEALAKIADAAQKVADDAQTVATSNGDVTKAMSQVRALSVETNKQSEQMTSGANRVVEAIQAVAAVSQETAASAEEMSATAQEVSHSATVLQQMAGELQEIADQFTIESPSRAIRLNMAA